MPRAAHTVKYGNLTLSADVGASWLLDAQTVSTALKRANRAALEAAGEQMIQDTNPYVPKFSGLLRESADIDIEHSSSADAELAITYSRPLYIQGTGQVREIAQKLYKGISPRTGRSIQNWFTEGTGPDWFQVAWDNHSDEWLEKFDRDFVDSLYIIELK